MQLKVDNHEKIVREIEEKHKVEVIKLTSKIQMLSGGG